MVHVTYGLGIVKHYHMDTKDQDGYDTVLRIPPGAILGTGILFRTDCMYCLQIDYGLRGI